VQLRCDENIKCCYVWAVENTGFGRWAKMFNKKWTELFWDSFGTDGKEYLVYKLRCNNIQGEIVQAKLCRSLWPHDL